MPFWRLEANTRLPTLILAIGLRIVERAPPRNGAACACVWMMDAVLAFGRQYMFTSPNSSYWPSYGGIPLAVYTQDVG